MGNSKLNPGGDAERRREEDLELVRRARTGDSDAFNALFNRYRERIYRIVFKYVFDADDALDVTQEAFIRAFKALDSFKEDANFYTWLCRISINKAIDFIRSRKTRKSVSFEMLTSPGEPAPAFEGPEQETPHNKAQLAELKKAVAEAIGELPEYHRDVIVLNGIEDLSYKEVAETLGISVGTVMSRLHYARRALKERLKEFI